MRKLKYGLIFIAIFSVFQFSPVAFAEENQSVVFPTVNVLKSGYGSDAKTVGNYYDLIFDKSKWSNQDRRQNYLSSFEKARNEGDIFVTQHHDLNDNQFTIFLYWSEKKSPEGFTLSYEKFSGTENFQICGDKNTRLFQIMIKSGEVYPNGGSSPTSQGSCKSFFRSAGSVESLFSATMKITPDESAKDVKISGFKTGIGFGNEPLELLEYENIFDCSSEDFSQKLGCLFEKESSEATFGLNKLVAEPIKTLILVNNGACQIVRIPLFNHYVDLPCISKTIPSNFVAIFGTIWLGLITWWVVISLLEKIRSVHDPQDDRIEVTKL